MNLSELNTQTQTKDSQSSITPSIAMELLMEGNKRFMDGKSVARDLHKQVSDTGSGQFPFATVLSCIDSRVSSEIIFDQGIGDIFSIRIAGNFVNEDILGSMEFACKLAGTKVILILGHTSCGAVKGACDHAKLGNLTAMLSKITPAVDSVLEPADQSERTSSNISFVNAVAQQNVKMTIERIKNESPVLNEMLQSGDIEIKGGMYDIHTGRISLL